MAFQVAMSLSVLSIKLVRVTAGTQGPFHYYRKGFSHPNNGRKLTRFTCVLELQTSEHILSPIHSIESREPISLKFVN